MNAMITNFVRFSIEKITTYINADGKEKKKPIGMPKDWTKKITAENYKEYLNPNHKAMCLLTGKINNLTVIDFDDKAEYEKILTIYPNLANHKTIQTKRGFHIYCNYNPNVLTTTNGLINYNAVDIASDGHMVFAPPTRYVDTNDEMIYYKDLGGHILDIPDIILNDLKQNKNNLPIANVVVQSLPIANVISSNPLPVTNNKDLLIIKQIITNGLLDGKANGNYNDWISVGFAIKHTAYTEEGKQLWIEFSKINQSKYDENAVINFWTYTKQCIKKPITIASIKKWAKDYDNEKYDLLFKKMLDNSYDKETEHKDWLIQEAIITQTDVGFARAFVAHYGDTFKATGGNYKTDAIWYYNNTTKLWNKDAGLTNIRLLISNDLRNLFKNIATDECNEKKLKALEGVFIKLEKTNDKNNITREICDFIIDTKFEKKLNNQPYLLPIKNNKIINMNTLEITDRTMTNYFSFECNAEYVEMTDDDEADIKQYLLDLFCGKEDTMKCMIDIIKSSLSGKVLRYIFFHTGSGRNGKSLFFKLLNNIFNQFMDIISKDVILQKKSNSHLNTEFEKLQTCRLAYITELTENDKLNNTNIKAISGGDPINLRTLQKTDATIIPTATNHILTNELPSFKEDSAMRDRIIVCPYNNVFMVNANFETEMMGKTNLLFSYIIKYGVIRDKFELTEEMKIATNEYNDDNSVDNLKEFINLRCEKVEGMKILRNDFVKCYNEWLLSNYKAKDNKTSTKFTKEMKSKYKINNKESNSKLYYIDLQWKIEEPEV